MQRSKALHRVNTDPGSIPGFITTGCDRESHRAAHNWPSVVRVRAYRSLVTPCGALDFGRQLYSVSSDTLVLLASRLMRAVCQKAVRLEASCFKGRMALDLRLSRVHTGVAAMGQDCNYQLDITKKGLKYSKNNNIAFLVQNGKLKK